MIRNFTDPSANQRTFLAWIRTGVAVIAFGFVVEKFNLFILVLANTAGIDIGRTIRMERLVGPLGHYEGLSLMATGIALIAIAGLRFALTARRISAQQPYEGGGVKLELTVAIVLVFLVALYCVSILSR
jgi:putative membrane protein